MSKISFVIPAFPRHSRAGGNPVDQTILYNEHLLTGFLHLQE
ncbi:MAG: hypothetical protein OXS28_03240 [Gammaproteobacteria bacterium]|nr:hypothetical protein [Gammaproteobacteria bacterium]